MSRTPLNLRDGYHDLPPGKLASVVTYLEMTAPPAPTAGAERRDLSLRRLGPDDAERYAAIYRSIGERWLWVSRLGLLPEQIATLLGQKGIEAYGLVADGQDAGLVELDLRNQCETELVYFGLAERFIGTGAGRWMMRRTLEIAWSRPIRRLWLHTCTLDHPGAVGFYRKAGLRPYKLAVEIIDDPRVTGALPRDRFPDLPLTA